MGHPFLVHKGERAVEPGRLKNRLRGSADDARTATVGGMA